MSENYQAFVNRPTLLQRIGMEPSFSTFLRLLRTSRAIELFSGDSDYTVFVPTDEAFKKLGRDDMDALVDEPGQATLKVLLSYHLVPGIFTVADLREMTSTRSV